MLKVWRKQIKFAAFAAWFLLCTVTIFPQDEFIQRGSIPEELLRPRRDEAPRYPIDMVIGTLDRARLPAKPMILRKMPPPRFWRVT